jgi:hypothetical protein
MERSRFVEYLLTNGCVHVRDQQGKFSYSVYRNVLNGLQSGLIFDNPLNHSMVCRICKTLGIDSPEEALGDAQAIVDIAHRNHNKKPQK